MRLKQVDYDMSGVATDTETDELIREAKNFRAMGEEWVRQIHPQYALPAP